MTDPNVVTNVTDIKKEKHRMQELKSKLSRLKTPAIFVAVTAAAGAVAAYLGTKKAVTDTTDYTETLYFVPVAADLTDDQPELKETPSE